MIDTSAESGNLSSPQTDPAADAHQAALAAGRECLEAALRYLALDWPPLVCCPPDHLGVGRTHAKNCTSQGKAPFGPWKEFQTRLPTIDELRQKWRDLPNGNVGIALGRPGGPIRLDVEGAAGEARLAELSQGELPPTPAFRSGRADGTGRGLLYRLPEGLTWRTRAEGLGIGAELRIQGLGAQTVLPPSRHKEGGRYSWLPGRSPWEIVLAPAPPWLVRLMAEQARGGGGRRRAEPLADGEMIPGGSRNSVLASLAGTMRRRGFSREAIAAALRVENEARCDPPLDAAEVDGIAERIARYAPTAVPGACGNRCARPAHKVISCTIEVR
jgi:hypothetical protein